MKEKLGKILIIDDDADVLTAARLFLKQHADLVHAERDPALLPGLLRNEAYDIVLLDMNFTRDVSSGTEGFFWLDRILQIDPSSVVVLITAYGDVEMAVRAIKAGASDFVLKPWQNERLLATLMAAMAIRRSRLEVEHLRSRQQLLSSDLDQGFQEFIGSGAAMQEVFGTIQKVARTDANVLILGENGTGKELVARELHRRSARAQEVFFSVDMGALSETLAESELFGHVRGAFTDAREDRPGRFEIASGGTLFLDEVGNLPLSLQSKLLTVLQNREVTRVGSNKSRPIDIRLISATNVPLNVLVEQKSFRQDLLYRLNTVEISLPPLRERVEDIPLLANHFLFIYSRKYQKSLAGVTPATMRKLEKYRWPGNVRELQHAVERAVIMSDSRSLQPSDFFFPAQARAPDTLTIERFDLEDVEKTVIRKALAKHRGNVSQAAHELGLTRAALYRRLEKYAL
ncbi:MAG TPA: sigma-54 dependent transcriptional regulator [Bacteroidota bacterium]|nr:sigma-54 dependent transcriptional regulator [Bacteroidota bacterium]